MLRVVPLKFSSLPCAFALPTVVRPLPLQQRPWLSSPTPSRSHRPVWALAGGFRCSSNSGSGSASNPRTLHKRKSQYSLVIQLTADDSTRKAQFSLTAWKIKAEKKATLKRSKAKSNSRRRSCWTWLQDQEKEEKILNPFQSEAYFVAQLLKFSVPAAVPFFCFILIKIEPFSGSDGWKLLK